ncbi:MAG: oligopeptide/dipeptide transporter, ATPase subunit, partial [Rhizobacter sp.]|nr:oligopeptide/dipeptide transporter, ATPase subunit [Rhizobacter sp.]
MLSLINLTLGAQVGGRQVDLLRNVSFTVGRGRVLGLVGESGAGKSMIGRLVAGHMPPGFEVTKGRVLFDGGELLSMNAQAWRRLLGRRIAFIPQEPLTALNPVLTIGQTFDEHLMLLGVPSNKRASTIRAQLGSVQLPDPAEIARRYPHELSGGQCQRVLIAMAFSANPSLIIADEPTTALDVVSQARVMSLLSEQQRRHETAVVLITHDLRLAAHVCDEIAVLYAGEQVEYGPAADVLNRPRHPYTVALRDATPDVGGERRLLPSLRGQMPGLSVLATMPGCRFAPRCPTRNAACESAVSSLREVAPGHHVRCSETCQVRGDTTQDITQDIALAMAADRPAEPFIASVDRPVVESMAAPPVGDASAMPVVELRDVTLSYTARRGLFGRTKVTNDAVSHLSLAVQPGEFVGIVGESGSGKSSVARLIVGSEQATEGSVLIEGQDRSMADASFLRLAREHV